MTRGSHHAADNLLAKKTLRFEQDLGNPLHTKARSQQDSESDEPIATQGSTVSVSPVRSSRSVRSAVSTSYNSSRYKDKKVDPANPLFLPSGSSEGFERRSSRQSTRSIAIELSSSQDVSPFIETRDSPPHREQLELYPIDTKNETPRTNKTLSRKPKKTKKLKRDQPSSRLHVETQPLKQKNEVTAAVPVSEPGQGGTLALQTDTTNRYHTTINNRTLLHNRNAILSTEFPQEKGKGRKRKNASCTEPESRKRQRENHH